MSTDRAVSLTRILVIDDDAAVAKMIAHILRAAHDVVIEASPRSALARLGTDTRFDLILCDITMPELSGIQVYEAISALDVDLAARVVFMTGGGLSSEEDGFLSDAGVPRLAKPFRPAEIRTRVRELIDRWR
jgi:CheY-like chemotaxis protein